MIPSAPDAAPETATTSTASSQSSNSGEHDLHTDPSTPNHPHPLAKQPPPPQLAPVRRKPLPSTSSPSTITPGSSTAGSDGGRDATPRLTDDEACGEPAVASPVSEPALDAEDAVPAASVDGSVTFDHPPRRSSSLLPSPVSQEPPLERADAASQGCPSHPSLASEPVVSVAPGAAASNSGPNPGAHQRSATASTTTSTTSSSSASSRTMSLHAPLQPPRNNTTRPPPLRVDSGSDDVSGTANDHKPTPKTPGAKITSFFTWKNAAASPGAESTSTEISESGVSPLPSPMNLGSGPPPSATKSSYSDTQPNMPPPARSQTMTSEPDLTSRVAEMEAELRELSSELAGSIRREMELEDMVERLQMEANVGPDPNRRTSDYFSDSGNGSVKYAASDAGSGKPEDLEKLKRSFEQQHGQLKVELSQKWQEERSRRHTAESHVQILEDQVAQFRREKVDNSNLSSKTKELESALEDTRRRLAGEREVKDNYEDLLTAMRVDLERNKTEKDQLEAELRSLRRGTRFDSIAEEGDPSAMRGSGGLARSTSARVPRSGLSRSGSLSRPSSMVGKDRDFQAPHVDPLKDTEMQRDALHRTVKGLLDRQAHDARQNEKRIKLLEVELQRARLSRSPRKKGYEREVTGLREEISVLRRRADDALDQKWQCEKGLAGLKMDLDRAEQETSSLRNLLEEQAHKQPGTQDEFSDFQSTATSLETTYQQFQAESRGGNNGNLADAVRQRVARNSSLKERLSKAIGQGERDQQLSVTKINEMQARLKELEDKLMLAQQHSEEEVAKHEQEVNALKESHNAQLQRLMNGDRTPGRLSPILPNSPFSGGRSPRLSRTSSGEAIALNQAVQTGDLETKVKNLEKALREADLEMGEVVSRMNKAQMEVAELQSDRDEALRETRRLQAEMLAQR